MFSQMPSHIILELELFVTYWTRVEVRLVVFVHMMFQEMRAFECFHTDCTCVVVIMCQQVSH